MAGLFDNALAYENARLGREANDKAGIEQMRQAAENERTMAEIDARVEMNTADNATAMRLAAAEISSGEKFSVSTGTGINPGTR